ncbi:hypothetical protein EV426DRAFT_645415 [Tirmania nivea]|nr:hypothetical protein EV426DRAFT_645415 [Tirmania nivea]
MSNPKPEEKTYMTWSKDDVERLVGWMEENQEALRGQQKKWHKDIKEEVFADEGITVNRIRDKLSNIQSHTQSSYRSIRSMISKSSMTLQTSSSTCDLYPTRGMWLYGWCVCTNRFLSSNKKP